MAWLLSLLTLLAASLTDEAAAAPTEAADTSSGQSAGRGRSGKRGFMVRRRPPPGYNQATIEWTPESIIWVDINNDYKQYSLDL